ncbi:MAG: hypothetical protein ACJ73L_08490 [Actinomycetes bacterium]
MSVSLTVVNVVSAVIRADAPAGSPEMNDRGGIPQIYDDVCTRLDLEL